MKKERERNYKQQEVEYYAWLEKRNNSYPGDQYQSLFDHMCDQHGVILTQSEMYEIIQICKGITAGREAGSDGNM